MNVVEENDHKRKLPAASGSDKIAIDKYLMHMLGSIELAMNDAKATQMSMPSAMLAGQIAYYRAQCSTIRWLLEVNLQRGTHAKDTVAGGSGI